MLNRNLLNYIFFYLFVIATIVMIGIYIEIDFAIFLAFAVFMFTVGIL